MRIATPSRREHMAYLTKDEVAERFRGNRDFPRFITWLLGHFETWESIELGLDEFKRLLLNSYPYAWPETRDKLATLEETVRFIQLYPEYLEAERKDRGINGAHVARYLERFRGGEQLEDAIVLEKDPDMRQDGSFYIGDGMHRLVAYGLHSGLEEEFFPIRVVYASDKIDEPFEG